MVSNKIAYSLVDKTLFMVKFVCFKFMVKLLQLAFT